MPRFDEIQAHPQIFDRQRWLVCCRSNGHWAMYPQTRLATFDEAWGIVVAALPAYFRTNRRTKKNVRQLRWRLVLMPRRAAFPEDWQQLVPVEFFLRDDVAVFRRSDLPRLSRMVTMFQARNHVA